MAYRGYKVRFLGPFDPPSDILSMATSHGIGGTDKIWKGPRLHPKNKNDHHDNKVSATSAGAAHKHNHGS